MATKIHYSITKVGSASELSGVPDINKFNEEEVEAALKTGRPIYSQDKDAMTSLSIARINHENGAAD